MLLDTRTSTKARAFDVGIRMVAYSPDGQMMVTAEGTDGARLWPVSAEGKLVVGHLDDVTEVTVLSTPVRVLITKDEAQNQRVFAAGFSADGRRFFTTDALGHVKIWQTKTGTLQFDITQTRSPVRGAMFHPNGKLIAFGDEAGVLHVWDLENKRLVRDVSTPEPIAAVEYSHDATRLATTHARIVMIWDPISWKAQVERGVHAAAFSPDGSTLALGSSDVRLLVPSTGATARTLPLADGPVTALAWRRDGRELAIGCMKGSVHLAPMP